MCNTYIGNKNQDGVTEVIVNNLFLSPRKDVLSFNSYQYGWGFKIEGAKQLASAILLNEYNNEDFAKIHWQMFYEGFIAIIWMDNFCFTSKEIEEFLLEHDIQYHTETDIVLDKI